MSLCACSTNESTPQASLIKIVNERASLSDKAETYQLSAKYYFVLQELEPDNPSNYIGYVRALRKAGDKLAFKKFINTIDLTSAVSKEQDFILEVLFSMLSFNLDQEAESFLEKRSKYIGNSARLLWLRGAVNFNRGEINAAERNYQRCLAQDAENEPCIYDYALLLKRTNQGAKLEEFLRDRNKLDLLQKLEERRTTPKSP